jgi:hypothetical protein
MFVASRRERQDSVLIEVRDNGGDIAEPERIFRPAS